jgi:phosphoribosyl 1,2-cyclic phosphodiesterase
MEKLFMRLMLLSVFTVVSVSSGQTAIGFPGFPDYPEGSVSPVYNAGPGMAVDQNAVTAEDSKMAVISNTSREAFAAYVQTLLSSGFTQASTSNIDANVFYSLKKENQLYYLYYTGSKNQVRIIQDNSSRTLIDQLDASEQGSGKTEFYLYSLDYTHGEGQTSKTDYWKIDCGAMLIIKLKDNSLFIVDAGHERQSSNAALEGLLNFMYQVTGQAQGTTINIRAWFFSHAHGDHVYMTYPFLEKYHETLDVQSVLFNIPSYQTMRSGYDAGTFLMKQAFNTYYPDCKYVKLHTGQRFSLQGVQFDVLFTHEDGVSSAGVTTISNFNETSTVLRMTMDGKKIMLLGDTDGLGESSLLSMYSAATLQSDCVQTTHHGYNERPALYKAIAAPLALFCNSSANAKDNNPTKYQDVIDATSNVITLFADPDTYKLIVENGVFKYEAIPSYRSYFTTVTLPNLTLGNTSSSGDREELDTVLSKISLADKVIDKSVTGTASETTGESCSLILDGKTSTKFCTKSIPATLAWTMKEPVELKWYVLYTANDNDTRPGRNPQKWGLYGSNDATTWDCIDTVYNPQLPDKNYVGTAFSIADPVPYQYYALKIDSTDTAAVLQFSEIGLYAEEKETDVDQKPGFEEKPSVRINTIGNNQIVVDYPGNSNGKTVVTLYNMSGRKLVARHMQNGKAVIAAPVSGVYLVEVNTGKASIVKTRRVF